MNRVFKIILLSLFLTCSVEVSLAQLTGPGPSGGALNSSILLDTNGNARIIRAFGDSITRGVGDFNGANQSVVAATIPSGEAGYPLRIEGLLNIPVANLGDPGERLATQGLLRFVQIFSSAEPGVVIVSGGSNDAIDLISSNRFYRSLQTIINVGKFFGNEVVLATAPPTCCDHGGLNSLVSNLNSQTRKAAALNNIRLADINKAYLNTCSLGTCYLLNRPEGLHPNIEGYDVSGEVIIASLLGIDIFKQNGANMLEQALNLPEGSVRTQPDPA